MAITPLPPSPARTDAAAVFSAKADALLAALPVFVTEVNATVTAMNLESTNSTSATSMLIAVATKTFTVQAGKSYVPGQTVKIASTASPTNWMLGDVSAYNVSSGSLTVLVQYKQGAGTFAAWTISLAAPAPVTIPSGSQTLFYNAAAPTGWTQNTNADDYAIRLVNGAGGSPGGSVAFSTAFASKAVTGSNSATTLAAAHLPPHTHSNTGYDGATGGTAVANSGISGLQFTVTTGAGDSLLGQPHNHTFSGTAINLAVRYINMILCIKD